MPENFGMKFATVDMTITAFVLYDGHNHCTGYIDYCKALNICGIKISRFTENDILVEINFGGHEYHVPRK